MSTVESFFADIRSAAAFVAAASADPVWIGHLLQFERDVETIFRRGGDGPEWIELGDNILATIRKRDVSLQLRTSEIVELFKATRDKYGRRVN
jgi:hypothetical protein